MLLFLIPSRKQFTWYFDSLPPTDERLLAIADETGLTEVTRVPPNRIRAIASDGTGRVPWSDLGYDGGNRFEIATPRADFLLRIVAGLQVGLLFTAIRRWKTGAVPCPSFGADLRAAAWGLWIGVASILTSIAVTALLRAEPSDSPWSAIPDLATWPGALLLVFILAIGPVSEEAFFRGVVFQRFPEGRIVLGAVVSAWLFAAIHGALILLPAYFLVGILLAVAFVRGGLMAAILAHVVMNTAGVLWLFRAGRVGAEFSSGA